MENTNIDLEKLKTHLVQIGAKANLIDGVDKQTEDSTTENIKLDDKTEEQINEPDEDVLKKQLADLFENNLKQYDGIKLNKAIWLAALKYNPESEKINSIQKIINDVYSNVDDRIEFFKQNKTKYMLEEIAKFNEGCVRSDGDVESEEDLISQNNEFKIIADECIKLKNKIDLIHKSSYLPFNIRNNDIEKLIFKIEYNIFKSDIKYKHILLDCETMEIMDDLRKNYCTFTENKNNVFYGLMLRDIFDNVSSDLTNIVSMLTNNQDFFDKNTLKCDIVKIKSDLNKVLNEINKK